MRILLDNCVPARFASHLQRHEVETASRMGWDQKSDRDLLHLMRDRFDVLVTVDKKLSVQHRIADYPFAVITMRAKANQMQHLLRLLPKFKTALTRAQPGMAIEVS